MSESDAPSDPMPHPYRRDIPSTPTDRVTVRLPAPMMNVIEGQVERGEYANKSAAIRAALDAGLDETVPTEADW